jgi:hypothetical protein
MFSITIATPWEDRMVHYSYLIRMLLYRIVNSCLDDLIGCVLRGFHTLP